MPADIHPLKQIASDVKLKKESDTEARIKGRVSMISVREFLENTIALSAAEGLASETNLEIPFARFTTASPRRSPIF